MQGSLLGDVMIGLLWFVWTKWMQSSALDSLSVSKTMEGETNYCETLGNMMAVRRGEVEIWIATLLGIPVDTISICHMKDHLSQCLQQNDTYIYIAMPLSMAQSEHCNNTSWQSIMIWIIRMTYWTRSTSTHIRGTRTSLQQTDSEKVHKSLGKKHHNY